MRPRTVRLGQITDLFGHVRWLLGRRRNWVYLLPAISVLSAMSELIVLVCVVQSLLLLVDPGATGTIDVGPVSVVLSSGALLTAALSASVASLVLRTVDAVVVGRLAARAVWTARERLIDSYFSADWRAMAKLRSGHLQQLLGHNVQTVSGSVPMLGTMLTAMINLALYGTFIAVTSPIVGAMFAAIGAVVLSAFAVLRKRTRLVAGESQQLVRDVQLTSTTLTTLNRELQLFDVQEEARRELHSLNRDARAALRRMRTLQRLVPGLFQQVVLLAVVALVALAYALDIDGSTFGASAILALRSLSYLQQLNTSSQTYLEAAPYLREIRSAVDVHLDKARLRGTDELGSIRRLDLDSVTFRYESAPVLHEVSLTLEPGDWLGVVGPSGGGKTTLAGVIAGLLRPGAGEYLVNGIDAHAYSAPSWASRFALLSQDPALLRGSIEDNIRFFRPGGLTEVEAAAERAAVANDIRALPEGWETDVGDGQASLSGGQKQRIALARALFGDPQVLVLDEPTSALDAENERLIEGSLFALGPDAIVIVVSHRPTLLSRCNRFIVVENGRITASGGSDDIGLERYVGSLPILGERGLSGGGASDGGDDSVRSAG